MKTLHFYLTRQVLATLLMTVAVFTFVLLLGNVLKEILNLLVNRQVSLLVVAQAIVLLVPFVLVFALPMGFLTATLLVFGRFSADNELNAARASGISLLSLITPVLLLSVTMSCVCAVINTELGPRCRVAYKHLLFRLGMEKLDKALPQRVFIKDFQGYVIYAGKVEGTNLQEILLYELDDRGERVVRTFRAARGTVAVNKTARKMEFDLFDVWQISTYEGKQVAMHAGEVPGITLDLPERIEKETSLTDLSFHQLLQKRRELERKGINPLPVEVIMNSQAAFSFACIGFTLVGIPLGIRTHRRETSIGIAVALVLVLVYYSFIFLGQSLQTRPECAPHLIVWVPSFLFQVVGSWLLWRANRGI